MSASNPLDAYEPILRSLRFYFCFLCIFVYD